MTSADVHPPATTSVSAAFQIAPTLTTDRRILPVPATLQSSAALVPAGRRNGRGRH